MTKTLKTNNFNSKISYKSVNVAVVVNRNTEFNKIKKIKYFSRKFQLLCFVLFDEDSKTLFRANNVMQTVYSFIYFKLVLNLNITKSYDAFN